MKIAIYSHHKFEQEFIEDASKKRHELIFTEEKLSSKNVDFAKDCEVVILFSSDKADKEVLKKLDELGISFIATRSAGTDHIDLEAAEEFDIKIANVPTYSPNAIAEHCIALTLALFRKLKTSFERIGNYNFSLDGQVGREINGCVFGICGTGDIGEVLASIAHGFGAKVLLYDAEENPNLKDKSWAEYTSKEDLLERSDIVSLNLPLNDETENFISKKELKSMKNSAILINTGRGGLVQTKAVRYALNQNELAGFGMDVYENEKSIFYKDLSDSNEKDELLMSLTKMENVIVTAHQAFLTDEALSNMMDSVFESIARYDKGEDIQNLISE